MGKATIISEQGSGQYTVDLIYDQSAITSLIANLEGEIDTLNSVTIPAQEEINDTLDQSVTDRKVGLNAAIAAGEGIELATALLIDAANAASAGQLELDILNTDVTSRESAITALQSLTFETEQVSAWCADLTEGLEGDIGTIEIPDEKTEPVILKPGGGESTGAVWVKAEDGQLIHPEAFSPEGFYFNLGVLPGVQKWRPHWRIGIVSNIDTDANTCSVSLVGAVSSVQAIDVNAENSYSNVPVEYLTCNAAAFETGDRAVVEFTETGGEYIPKVIGFESNPKACGRIYRIRIDSVSEGTPVIKNLLMQWVGNINIPDSSSMSPYATSNREIAGDILTGGFWIPEEGDALPQAVGFTLSSIWIEEFGGYPQRFAIQSWPKDETSRFLNRPVDFTIESKNPDDDDWTSLVIVTGWKSNNVYSSDGSGYPFVPAGAPYNNPSFAVYMTLHSSAIASGESEIDFGSFDVKLYFDDVEVYSARLLEDLYPGQTIVIAEAEFEVTGSDPIEIEPPNVVKVEITPIGPPTPFPIPQSFTLSAWCPSIESGEFETNLRLSGVHEDQFEWGDTDSKTYTIAETGDAYDIPPFTPPP